jgi:hypothetical protein
VLKPKPPTTPYLVQAYRRRGVPSPVSAEILERLRLARAEELSVPAQVWDVVTLMQHGYISESDLVHALVRFWGWRVGHDGEIFRP